MFPKIRLPLRLVASAITVTLSNVQGFRAGMRSGLEKGPCGFGRQVPE